MAKTRSQSQEAPPKLTIGSLTKSQRKKLQNISSKYEIWYTLGVLNLLVTAVVAVRFPAYFWIYYFLKILYYVPYRYYRFEKKNWELCLLDWCYVVNYISDICVLLAGLRTTFGIKTPLYPYNADLIRAGFSMACGPLASSVYIFRNSIVFYDVDHSTSVFIHLAHHLYSCGVCDLRQDTDLAWSIMFGPKCFMSVHLHKNMTMRINV
jgi:hypothetical protein